ncbi:MAG: CDP-glycerol glycerophosphotransferase family protein [Elusimicrobiota bacterium]|nr:CDP-glycerol glycerophosphotransferase family protein [Endomicrobiia bacterium]MDW8166255.1 CDP-glycerol glycerophosphotransferase family protein [Elusimicrobiota bacterium]
MALDFTKNKKYFIFAIKETLKFISDIPLVVLSYLIPKESNLYVFISHVGDKFNDNPKYLYFYFKKKGKKVVYICSDKSLLKRLTEKGINAVYSFSLKGIWTIARAKYIFITHSVKGVSRSLIGGILGNFNIIQTWHGIGFKSIALLDPNSLLKILQIIISTKILKVIVGIRFKVILATSDAIKEKFEKAFSSKNVFITGLPRNDVLFNHSFLFVDYRRDLGLNKFDKVILYAPTFRERQYAYPFTDDFLEKLDKWLAEKNYILLVKKHIYDRALKVESNYKRIWDISDKVEDVQELLPHIDVLISDYSSIITDFALLRRPIILYIYDLERFIKECRSFYFDPREVFPGPFAYSQEELIKILSDMSWFEDSNYKERYEKFLDFFHKYKDGKSCERVEKLLEEIS